MGTVIFLPTPARRAPRGLLLRSSGLTLGLGRDDDPPNLSLSPVDAAGVEGRTRSNLPVVWAPRWGSAAR